MTAGEPFGNVLAVGWVGKDGVALDLFMLDVLRARTFNARKTERPRLACWQICGRGAPW
jgi:hypothetical protein